MVPESTINQAVSSVRKIKAKKQRDEKAERRRQKINEDLSVLDGVRVIANGGFLREAYVAIQHGAGYTVMRNGVQLCRTGNYDYAIRVLKQHAHRGVARPKELGIAVSKERCLAHAERCLANH
jgi:hypothetical protein